ncbi:MAG: SAM-dependent methyltransferase, partial [Erysipelotrichaceae bacterium]|nr:SAM-dependent methyltransferase [Erysipelotrichaceae bacterium]
CGLKLLKRFASDGPTDYMRSTINAMDEETFAAYLDFHQKTCERKELLGASSHIVDILSRS